MLRVFIIAGLSLSIFSIEGCSLFEKESAAGTPAAAAQTAYYTCGGCHGAKNVRVELMPPNIIGQKQAYLIEKLHDFRDLKRIHPDMNGVMASMTDQDITNLAAYYANYGKW
jgi:cytochrome c553